MNLENQLKMKLRKLNKFFFRLFIVICLVATSYPAFSEPVVKIAVGNFPPWVYMDGNDVRGADYDLIVKILDRMHIKYESEPMIFSDIIEGLKEGTVDISSGLFYREDRDKYIQYVSPPLRTRNMKGFYVLRSGNVHISKYNDLLGRRVAVCSGVRYFPVFDVDHRIEKVQTTSLEESLDLLLNKRVDVVASGLLLADSVISSLGMRDKVIRSDFVYNPRSAPSYLGISRKSFLLERSEELGAVLKLFQKNGEQERIMRKYLGADADKYLIK